MAVQALHQLFTGLIMSKITYALRAFAGQLTVDDRNRTSAISRKALRRGVTHAAFDIEEIIDNRKLFSKITHSGHCLHHLLPPSSSSRMRVINHNWSATKQRPHPQSVAEIRRLNTALTVLGKENTITSCLVLNFRCIKTVLLIDACLNLDDTLCVLYYF